MSLPLLHNNSIGRPSRSAAVRVHVLREQPRSCLGVWVRAAGELDIVAALELEQILRDAVIRARLLV